MPESRGPIAPPALERLIVQIGTAINTRSLYAAEHPRARQAGEAVLAALTAAFAERRQDEITFLVVGEDLVVGQRPLPTSSLYLRNFVRTLGRRRVERLTLARGLPASECEAFVEAMALGRVPVSSPHLIVGRVEVAVEADQPAAEPETLSVARVEAVKESWARFRKDPGGGLGQMEELVSAMMEALARQSREVLPLAPLKQHDEYTFVHSVNVSMLALAQARALGIQGDTLHAIGLAALSHDVGKLAIPLAVLNKPGKLEGEEWRVMQGHAEAGAWALAGMDRSHPLAIVVAYEHHLRVDGEPAYPTLARVRRPTLASQITSLADVFDAVCTHRPYSRARSRAEAFGVLERRAGTFHDPFLLGSFKRLLYGADGPEATPSGNP